jgi:HK97 family phage portal protein
MVLSSDLTLTPEQIQQIRDRWNEQAKHLGAGGTVILGAGMKPLPMSVTPVDAQLAEVMKMSDQKIALAFRVPLQLLGMSTTTFASTESLMQFWLASGLQFCINHIELAFDSLFGLSGQPNEYVEFDVSVLLRSEMKNRIEAFARSVTSGIHSPNEARAAFDLKRVDAGDEPRMQAQNVPLTAAENISAIPAAPPAPAALPAPKELTDVEQQRLRSTFRSSQSRHLAL